MQTIIKTLSIGLLTVAFASCESFLDEIPDRSLSALRTLSDYDQLMNYPYIHISTPAIQELSGDDLFIDAPIVQASHVRTRFAYTWQMDNVDRTAELGMSLDWPESYNAIYYCNVVLEGLESLDADPSNPEYRRIKAQALFVRAFQHFQLWQVYGQPYNPSTAGTALGIPYKRSALLQQPVSRETVQETFRLMIRDLETALESTDSPRPTTNVYRTSKAAVYALLSRIFLNMQNYADARTHAQEALSRYDTLLDYNDQVTVGQFSYLDHPEMLFYAAQVTGEPVFRSATTQVDPALYGSYANGDLRKSLFFQIDAATSTPYFFGMYTGTSAPFSGLATDEVYLILAECAARLGDIKAARDALNQLRINRFTPETYEPITEANGETLLAVILDERRKELVLRGTRWSDLRRLNQDSRFSKTLVRTMGGNTIQLPPNDPRYTFPIPPQDVILGNLIQNTY